MLVLLQQIILIIFVLSMQINMKNKKGFTLIELMVAIAIIVLLSVVGMVSYRAANKKARDSKRQSSLEQVRAALEMYRSDNDVYPGVTSVLVDGNYLSELPTDPRAGDGYGFYYSSTDGFTYSLCAVFEAVDPGDTCTGACGSETCNYQVTNP